MKFIAEINVMPHKNLLDPQGKAVSNSMRSIGYSAVDHVRIGKHISMEIEAESEAAARAVAEEACRKVLTNPVMEGYDFTVHPA